MASCIVDNFVDDTSRHIKRNPSRVLSRSFARLHPYRTHHVQYVPTRTCVHLLQRLTAWCHYTDIKVQRRHIYPIIRNLTASMISALVSEMSRRWLDDLDRLEVTFDEELYASTDGLAVIVRRQRRGLRCGCVRTTRISNCDINYSRCDTVKQREDQQRCHVSRWWSFLTMYHLQRHRLPCVFLCVVVLLLLTVNTHAQREIDKPMGNKPQKSAESKLKLDEELCIHWI